MPQDGGQTLNWLLLPDSRSADPVLLPDSSIRRAWRSVAEWPRSAGHPGSLKKTHRDPSAEHRNVMTGHHTAEKAD
ncbi:hypothetical protein NDU88_002759 [Pleurodeles waltl]|uniref:Uncharacterized protein n=1 Tax=Pleurodeles waltl TaxID=8319 RepID=A0AAV7TNI9_PLEWA|nr:hypothetical protein NDU88_002759 [Pleurodeles waltl]